jgi:hypothetical protein
MEEAPENSKESSHSAHANGMNERMNGVQIIFFSFLPHLLSLHFYLCYQPNVSSDLKNENVIMYCVLGGVDEYGGELEFYVIIIKLLCI